jgi:hypothetical protein
VNPSPESPQGASWRFRLHWLSRRSAYCFALLLCVDRIKV